MPYAADAVRFYNKEALSFLLCFLGLGENYELVESGFLTPVLRKAYLLHHIDFMDKKTDVLCLTNTDDYKRVRCVKFCKCMGPRDSISGDKNNGCCYCTWYNVQHPKGGGFSRGSCGSFRDNSGSSSSSNSKSLRLTDASHLSLDASKRLHSTDVSDW
ncbi:hypothetical protein MKX01_028444 [Papaver californicum]|nr:hypothetical protein MKX01_028444 [Papaver californicum]